MMSKQAPDSFGCIFYEQMPLSYFQNGQWSSPTWQASDAIKLHPGAHCLHYGSSVFEGAKAFRHSDNSIHIFRLDAHIERMRASADALYLPAPDAALFRQMMIELVEKAQDVVPDDSGALYLRPLILGIDPLIGNAGHPSHDALFYILASPSGDYFKQGSQLTILVETDHERCAPHMGMIKTGGNYASALHWTMEAERKYKAQQVLFCPNGDVQETGASNFMLIDGKTIITKGLTQQFLHGITRMSLLELAKQHGYDVEERDFTVEEIKERVARGAEAILTGTAAVLSPITNFIINDENIAVSSQKEGLKLRQLMTDLQYGRSGDPFSWLTRIS